MQPYILSTTRLRLRPWRSTDLPLFAQLNADPTVMQYFPKVLTTTESDALAQRIQRLIEQNAWGFWAVELIESDEFIGFTGLHAPTTMFDFSPCVEIGWRLDSKYWHQGYATEAAQACLNFAFQQLGLDAVVAFTAQHNRPSEKVMQRLGMQFVQYFDHPELASTDPLRRHKLYQISAHQFQAHQFQAHE